MMRNVGLSIAKSTNELMKKFPTIGKPFVFGSSEGASVASYLAVNHPDKFAAVFACSGELPKQFFPESIAGELPPVHFYHGINDGVIPITSAKRTFSDMKHFSEAVYFSEYDTGHMMTRSAVDNMKKNIAAYVKMSIALARS